MYFAISIVSKLTKAINTSASNGPFHLNNCSYTRVVIHTVAAAFLKHLLPYVTPRDTAKNAPDSDRGDIVE